MVRTRAATSVDAPVEPDSATVSDIRASKRQRLAEDDGNRIDERQKPGDIPVLSHSIHDRGGELNKNTPSPSLPSPDAINDSSHSLHEFERCRRIKTLPWLHCITDEVLSILSEQSIDVLESRAKRQSEPDAIRYLDEIEIDLRRLARRQHLLDSSDLWNIQEVKELPPEMKAVARRAIVAIVILDCACLDLTTVSRVEDNMFDIFMEENEPMQGWHVELFHAVKRFCYAKSSSASSSSSISSASFQSNKLRDYFPSDLESKLRSRYKGRFLQPLSPPETLFLERCAQSRKSFEQTFVENSSELFVDLDRQLLATLSDCTRKLAPSQSIGDISELATARTNGHGDPEDDVEFDEDDFFVRARLAAASALKGISDPEPRGDGDSAQAPKTAHLPTNTTSTTATEITNRTAVTASPLTTLSNSGRVMSFQEELERARIEASRQYQNNRALNIPNSSRRRPWTTEEEHALLQGLHRVGRHWSQILAMFGKGGTVSEILKGRSQVQLKDKARNLKLFYLKNNIALPEYLSDVTGDLKHRAPGYMAREARQEALRDAADEDRLTSNALNLLAGGMRPQEGYGPFVSQSGAPSQESAPEARDIPAEPVTRPITRSTEEILAEALGHAREQVQERAMVGSNASELQDAANNAFSSMERM